MRRLLIAALFAFSCGIPEQNDTSPADPDPGSIVEQRFSSPESKLVTFEFDGEVQVSGSASNYYSRPLIDEQMLFTIGHLNGNRSVGRLDRLVLSKIRVEGSRVLFHAKLPVAWGNRDEIPTSYEFKMPKKLDVEGLEAFTEKYKETCVDYGAHDVDSGSIWYYYRPKHPGCKLAPEDVLTWTATVSPNDENTTGKYPEYHRVWEDNELTAVAIFGKYEDGATDEDGDAGIEAYNSFVRRLRNELSKYTLTTTPANVPSTPGTKVPDVTFTATLPDGKKVRVTALLVDNVRTAGATFDARYRALSPNADVIFYGGHAGLGENVRALANKGSFLPGKYLILFMDGCDTFAYVDGSLAERRAYLNRDDPTGTKYMEIITNAMPAYFQEDAPAAMALIRSLMSYKTPFTYEQILAKIDPTQVVIVTGEEDNEYVPGGETVTEVLKKSGTVVRSEEDRFETAVLPAGTYRFELSGSGDADLYVRVGTAPTTRTYDCRPWVDGSEEDCTITLDEKSTVHVMVRGYADESSSYKLIGNAD